MTQILRIHPANPQLRLIETAVGIIHKGGVVVYPTDSGYALGCHLGDKDAIERIRRIRQLTKEHNFTVSCRDLSEISTYARVDNPTFRLLKAHTPGAYTFILQATREVPKQLQHPKRKTIGIRIPDHTITQLLLETLNQPLMSVTLIMPGDDIPLFDIDEVIEQLSGQVDSIIDGGACGLGPTTVVDLTGDSPEVVREGQGDLSPFKASYMG